MILTILQKKKKIQDDLIIHFIIINIKEAIY